MSGQPPDLDGEEEQTDAVFDSLRQQVVEVASDLRARIGARVERYLNAGRYASPSPFDVFSGLAKEVANLVTGFVPTSHGESEPEAED